MGQINYPFYEILCVDTGPQEISSSNFEKLNEWMLISADVLGGNYENLPPRLSGVTISDYIEIKRIPDDEYIPPYMTSVFIDIDRSPNILWRSSSRHTDRLLYDNIVNQYALSDTEEHVVFIEELNEYRLIPPKIDFYTLSSLTALPGDEETNPGVGYGSPVIRNMAKPWPKNATRLSVMMTYVISNDVDESSLSNLVVEEVLWHDELSDEFPSEDFPHAFIRENGHWVPSAVWYEGKKPQLWDWMPLSAGYYSNSDMLNQLLYGKIPWLSTYSKNPLYKRNWSVISDDYEKNPVTPYPNRPTFEQPMFGTEISVQVDTTYKFGSAAWPGVYVDSGKQVSSLLTQEVKHYYYVEGGEYDVPVYHEYFPEKPLPDGAHPPHNTFTINWPNSYYVNSIVPKTNGPSILRIPDNHAKYIIGRETEQWPYYQKTWYAELSSSTVIPVQYNGLYNNFPYPWFRFTSEFRVQNPPGIEEKEYTTYRNILEGHYPWRAIPTRNRLGEVTDWLTEEINEPSVLLSNPGYVPWPYTGLEAWQGYDGFSLDRLKYYDVIWDDESQNFISSDVLVATFSAFSEEQYDWIGSEYDLGSYKFGSQLNGYLEMPCNVYRYEGDLSDDFRESRPVSVSRFNPWSTNTNTIIGDHIKEITFYYPYDGRIEFDDDPFARAKSTRYLTDYLTKLNYPYWDHLSSLIEEGENAGEIEWTKEFHLSTLNHWAQPVHPYTKTNPDGTISTFYQPKGYDIFGTCLTLNDQKTAEVFLPNKMYAVVQIDTMPNRLTAETITNAHTYDMGANLEDIPLESYNLLKEYTSYGKFNEYYGEATDPNGEDWKLDDPNPDFSAHFEENAPEPGYIEGNEDLEFRLTNFFALFESARDVSRLPTKTEIKAGIAKPVTFKFKELLPHSSIRINTANYTNTDTRLEISKLASVAEDIAKNFTLSVQIIDSKFGLQPWEEDEDEDEDEDK